MNLEQNLSKAGMKISKALCSLGCFVFAIFYTYMDKKFDYLRETKKVFDEEIEALEKTRDALGEDFETILNLILDCEGKLILTGMGKPSHIVTKMSATIASLGIPSFFMYQGEDMHDDLSVVKKDVVMLII